MAALSNIAIEKHFVESGKMNLILLFQMFGQSGGGMGPWQGQHGNKNMDAETLAQTLVTVAQNLLSTQSQVNERYCQAII